MWRHGEHSVTRATLITPECLLTSPSISYSPLSSPLTTLQDSSSFCFPLFPSTLSLPVPSLQLCTIISLLPLLPLFHDSFFMSVNYYNGDGIYQVSLIYNNCTQPELSSHQNTYKWKRKKNNNNHISFLHFDFYFSFPLLNTLSAIVYYSPFCISLSSSSISLISLHNREEL